MPDRVPIRLATPADAVQIAQLSRDTIEHGLPWSWTPQRVAHAIRDADTNGIVADERGSVAGFGIMRYDDEAAHLLLLAVRQDRCRSGIGSALVDWLEQAARAAGTACILVESRWDKTAARSFYCEHGYHEHAIEPGLYGRAVDGVLLQKWLRHTHDRGSADV